MFIYINPLQYLPFVSTMTKSCSMPDAIGARLTQSRGAIDWVSFSFGSFSFVTTKENEQEYQLLIGKGNRIGATTPSTNPGILVFDGVSRVFSYQMAQNPIASQWIANGSPEGLVSGQQGTTAIDKTRVADNKYQLNTIDGNTGWTLLSEMGKQVLVEDDFDIIGSATFDVNIDNSQHKANINVFSSLNPWNTPSGVGLWKINNNLKAFPSGGGQSVAILNSLVDCEIKMLFEANVSGSGLSYCGIVFRYVSNSNLLRYYFQYNGGVPSLILENLAMSINYPLPSIILPDSKIIELKIKLKSSFISVFYNDLLLSTIVDNTNNTSTKHGMRGHSAFYQVHYFKIIK